MNRHSIHQQIDSLLKIIRDQHDQLKAHSGSIPQVELDFMIQNLRQLYEATLLLNHTNALSSLDEVKAAVTQKILAEKRSLQMKKSEDAEPEKELVAAVPDQMESPGVTAAAVTGITEPEIKPEKSIRKKTVGDLNTQFEHTPTLGDKFGGGESLNKKIAAQIKPNSVAQKLHKNPIKDLTAAIGINEKFLFINNLFDGNLQSYSAAVEKLNTVNDLNSARSVIQELAGQFNWNEGSEHVGHFRDLIERRFS